MNELIKVETNENMEVVVSGRDLHEKLGIKTLYKDWIKRMIEYGFTENIDFVTVAQKNSNSSREWNYIQWPCYKTWYGKRNLYDTKKWKR